MTTQADIRDMFSPVRCAYCSTVYDLGKVEVTGRYTDCSVWKSPCCNRTVDDRGETGWKPTKDYYKVDKNAPEWDTDVFGNVMPGWMARRG